MTPQCPSCLAAESDPLTGLYHAGCRDCEIRAVAGSPMFARVMAGRQMTPEWLAALERVAGADKAAKEALHQRVKAAYIRRMQG
jgi:hypothetical protein